MSIVPSSSEAIEIPAGFPAPSPFPPSHPKLRLGTVLHELLSALVELTLFSFSFVSHVPAGLTEGPSYQGLGVAGAARGVRRRVQLLLPRVLARKPCRWLTRLRCRLSSFPALPARNLYPRGIPHSGVMRNSCMQNANAHYKIMKNIKAAHRTCQDRLGETRETPVIT